MSPWLADTVKSPGERGDCGEVVGFRSVPSVPSACIGDGLVEECVSRVNEKHTRPLIVSRMGHSLSPMLGMGEAPIGASLERCSVAGGAPRPPGA